MAMAAAAPRCLGHARLANGPGPATTCWPCRRLQPLWQQLDSIVATAVAAATTTRPSETCSTGASRTSTYEYFGVLEVVSAGVGAPAIMTNATIEAGVDAYRCHGRFGGLHLADLGHGGAAGTDAVADVARAASCLVRQA